MKYWINLLFVIIFSSGYAQGVKSVSKSSAAAETPQIAESVELQAQLVPIGQYIPHPELKKEVTVAKKKTTRQAPAREPSIELTAKLIAVDDLTPYQSAKKQAVEVELKKEQKPRLNEIIAEPVMLAPQK
jgi:hypothetical protein